MNKLRVFKVVKLDTLEKKIMKKYSFKIQVPETGRSKEKVILACSFHSESVENARVLQQKITSSFHDANVLKHSIVPIEPTKLVEETPDYAVFDLK